MELPEINKTYTYFDDGKIGLSRMLKVYITEIIPFDKIDADTLMQWREEVAMCHWLYNTVTDYFIKGVLDTGGNTSSEVVFVRTKQNTWFSLGYWGGDLDVDGSLEAILNEALANR